MEMCWICYYLLSMWFKGQFPLLACSHSQVIWREISSKQAFSDQSKRTQAVLGSGPVPYQIVSETLLRPVGQGTKHTFLFFNRAYIGVRR